MSALYVNTILLYGCIKFCRFSENSWSANFFVVQGLLLSDSFCCQFYQSYFLNLDQEQFQKHLQQKVEGILFTIITSSICNSIVKSGATDQFCISFQVEVSIDQQQCTADISCFPSLKNLMISYQNTYRLSESCFTASPGELKMEETKIFYDF